VVKALDLFCCAGGATRGLQQAGFHVVGVDLEPQPNYCGDVFLQVDALEYVKTADLTPFDLILASPPCKPHTVLRHAPGTKGKAHPNLITPTRALLEQSGKPWVIENVLGARRHLNNPVRLCGSMFGLQAPGYRLQRHRLFEASFPLAAPSRCRHVRPVIGVYGGHFRDRRRARGANHRSGLNLPWEYGFIAMGVPIGSMTPAELSEAIPPAYARYVAEAFLAWLKRRRSNE
jgi:DNA (cytosine-5)-methyltransferase 1